MARTPCEQLTKRVTSRLRVPLIGTSLQQVTFEQWDNYEFTCKQNEKIIMQSVRCQIECPRDRKHSCTLVTEIWIRVFRVLFWMMKTCTWDWSRNTVTVFNCEEKNERRAKSIQSTEHRIIFSVNFLSQKLQSRRTSKSGTDNKQFFLVEVREWT